MIVISDEVEDGKEPNPICRGKCPVAPVRKQLTITFGHPSWDLVQSLMLGIRQVIYLFLFVASLSHLPLLSRFFFLILSLPELSSLAHSTIFCILIMFDILIINKRMQLYRIMVRLAHFECHSHYLFLSLTAPLYILIA